ncbi:TonB-dependent receptor [Olivibacter sp. SDN3]|uniref:SusC/RagA family TonB-linked outer membrane protein n=1 Tax=Olivibacter sp. SDN3 TaxID=2764720 RepID=UPI001651AF9C|nr:TonB-dependent receptor [Olivibacter sp. SDN3]QNL50487.1 TonB-dependent receptor [Olivibacter sp. SDN3]
MDLKSQQNSIKIALFKKNPNQLARLTLFLWVMLAVLSQVNAQDSQPIRGTVTGAGSNEPLPGVSVRVSGGQGGASTDANGNFTIDAKIGSTLTFTFVGYKTQDVVVNSATLSVMLEEDNQNLEEVVVVGYGQQKRGDITGAVTTMNTEQLTERPLPRVDQALVGQMAGVRVQQTTGNPGQGMSVQVRGVGSISAGNEPLYVVDGFPLSGASPNASGGYPTGTPLDNINPNDIESIQVLKDASAAAIYGSRAANGVVIITTKKGKSGKPIINLNTYAGFNERSRKLDVLSGEEWIDRAVEMINDQWVQSGSGRTASQSTAERRQLLGLADDQVDTRFMYDDRWMQPGYPGLNLIDWQDATFRRGLTQNYQLSASGGTDAVKYYVSGNYNGQEGMVKEQSFTSYAARANVEVKANERLTFGINLTPTYSINEDPGVEGKDNILHQLVSMSPVQEAGAGLYPNVGDIGQYQWSTSPNSPLGKLEQTEAATKRFRTVGSLFGQYEIVDGLTFKTTLNLDHVDNTFKRYIPFTITGSLPNRESDLTRRTSGTYSTFRRQTFVNENTLSYNKTLAENHNLSALLGFSYNSDKLDNATMSSQNGYGSSTITTLNYAIGVNGNTTETKNVLLSYFARLQYAFKDKYLLSASARRDGSSRFGANTKWGWFPSVSGGWRISEEAFMAGIKETVNDLKLRASWGTSGNYNIGDYSSLSLLGNYAYALGGELVTGLAPSGIFNPNLTWEKSNTIDVGLDVGFLNGRITAAVDYYDRKSTALLLNVPISQITGFVSSLDNAGSVRNRGWEFEVNSQNVVGNDFQWSTSFNFSHNNNKLLSLASGQSQILIPSEFDISHSILRVGDPMYSIYVVRQDGILSQQDIDNGVPLFGNQSAGDPRYFDANGDGVIDENDRMIMGQPNPKFIWGITNTFRYKGFDLSVLLQGQWGGHIYSLFGRAVNRTGTGFVDNVIGSWRDRWRSEEDPGNGEVGKTTSTFGRIKNTDWLYPSDYLRVRNITLGYDLGRIVSKNIFSGARIFVTAENFFGFDRYDGGFNPEATNTNLSGSSDFPEAGDYGGLPIPKSLIFGLNVTF